MPAAFPGYPKKGITWLRQIVKNNERDWFMEHKPQFQAEVHAPTVAFVEALNDKLEKFAPDYVADPKKSIGRIYRDTRFSKDKTPYKTNMSAVFSRKGGKKDECAGFWVAVSAKGVDIVGGSYGPGTPQLTKIRKALDKDAKAFRSVCKRKALNNAMGSLQGETLKRAPRGWPEDHPDIDLLKHKQFYFHTHLPVSIVSTPDLVKEVARRFKLMTPFVETLDEMMK